jgi:hypothetical protein
VARVASFVCLGHVGNHEQVLPALVPDRKPAPTGVVSAAVLDKQVAVLVPLDVGVGARVHDADQLKLHAVLLLDVGLFGDDFGRV